MKSEVVISMKSHQSAVTWKAGKIKFVCVLLKKINLCEENEMWHIKITTESNPQVVYFEDFKNLFSPSKSEQKSARTFPYK